MSYRRSDLVGTPAEVADVLGVEKRIVDRLIKEGRLPCVRLSPRHTVVSWAALEEWLARESRTSVNGQDETPAGG